MFPCPVRQSSYIETDRVTRYCGDVESGKQVAGSRLHPWVVIYVRSCAKVVEEVTVMVWCVCVRTCRQEKCAEDNMTTGNSTLDLSINKIHIKVRA